jgi:hypothetical protein
MYCKSTGYLSSWIKFVFVRLGLILIKGKGSIGVDSVLNQYNCFYSVYIKNFLYENIFMSHKHFTVAEHFYMACNLNQKEAHRA